MPLNVDWTKGHLAVPAAVLFPAAQLCAAVIHHRMWPGLSAVYASGTALQQ